MGIHGNGTQAVPYKGWVDHPSGKEAAFREGGESMDGGEKCF